MGWVPPEQPSIRAEPGREQDEAVVHARGPALWVRLVGVLVAIGLVGGMASSLLFSGDEQPSRDDGDLRTVRDSVAELSDFIEGRRSERFRHPVEVSLLDDDAFVERLLEDAEEDREEIEKTEELLGVLDLLEPTGGLFDELSSFLSASVVGFYDPETDELVVRGVELTPFVRLTLVHELTHALDDQLFDLDREELIEADDERGLGFSALVEGSALSVESAYRRSLTSSDRRRADEEEARFGDNLPEVSIPEVVPALIGFPYEVGEDLITTIERNGGKRALREAFANPPSTSEQLLHPERYTRGEGPVMVEPPAAEGALIDEGSVGELVLRLMLDRVLDDPDDVIRAADGWGGDWYVAWREGSMTCVRAVFVMDTGKDLDQLADGLRTWSSLNADSRIEVGRDALTLTACRGLRIRR